MVDDSDSRLSTRYTSAHRAHFVDRDANWYRRRARYFQRRVGSYLPQNHDARILDVACGAGEFLSFASQSGYTNCVGIDLSSQELAVARANGVTNVVETEAVQYLHAAPRSFEFILLSHILEHFPKSQSADLLEAVRDALVPGGICVVLTPNAASPLGLPYAFGDFTHETYFSGMSLAQVAAVADLEVLDVTGAQPQRDGPSGILKFLVWQLARRFLGSLQGTSAMRYGNIPEAELIAVLRARGALR